MLSISARVRIAVCDMSVLFSVNRSYRTYRTYSRNYLPVVAALLLFEASASAARAPSDSVARPTRW